MAAQDTVLSGPQKVRPHFLHLVMQNVWSADEWRWNIEDAALRRADDRSCKLQWDCCQFCTKRLRWGGNAMCDCVGGGNEKWKFTRSEAAVLLPCHIILCLGFPERILSKYSNWIGRCIPTVPPYSSTPLQNYSTVLILNCAPVHCLFCLFDREEVAVGGVSKVKSARRADASIINCGKSNSFHVVLHVDQI
jgi:hypothetical protein